MLAHQLSGIRICLAEWTKHGSAWFGELKILTAYSFVEAITMKLGASCQNFAIAATIFLGLYAHVENTDDTERTGVPLPQILLHCWVDGVRKLSDDRYGPFWTRKM